REYLRREVFASINDGRSDRWSAPAALIITTLSEATMTTIDDNPSSGDLPARVYTDDEALEDLLSIGRTSMTGSALARQWGWNDMRVSRRLRAWEESGLITRRNGEIVTAITPKYQPLNTSRNAPAPSHSQPVMTDRWSDNLSLRFVAFGLFLTGAAINGF